MSREIALSKGGIALLNRPKREDEKRPGRVVDALKVWKSDVVANHGAESGHLTFRIAPKVGRTGRRLAADIRTELLETVLVGRRFLISYPHQFQSS